MLQLLLTILLYLLLVIPMGEYVYCVAAGERTMVSSFFDKVNGVIYKLCGVKACQGMNWHQ